MRRGEVIDVSGLEERMRVNRAGGCKKAVEIDLSIHRSAKEIKGYLTPTVIENRHVSMGVSF